MGAIVEDAQEISLAGLRTEHAVTVPFEIPEEMAKRVTAATPKKGSFRAQRAIDAAVGKVTGGKVTDMPALIQQTIGQLRSQAHLDLYATGSWSEPGSVDIRCVMIPSGVTSLPMATLRPCLETLDPSTVTVACEHPTTGAIGLRRERTFVVRWVLDLHVPKTGTRYEYYLRKHTVLVHVDHYEA